MCSLEPCRGLEGRRVGGGGGGERSESLGEEVLDVDSSLRGR